MQTPTERRSALPCPPQLRISKITSMAHRPAARANFSIGLCCVGIVVSDHVFELDEDR